MPVLVRKTVIDILFIAYNLVNKNVREIVNYIILRACDGNKVIHMFFAYGKGSEILFLFTKYSIILRLTSLANGNY